MSKSEKTPELTAEQQRALDAHGGVVQGQSFVLMRTDVVLSYFGYDSNDELRRELQLAFDQADRGDLHSWDVEEFLERMRRERGAEME